MRAQGAYKEDKHARPTHAHTPTHIHHKNTSIVVMGLMETEERTREISRQKRRGGFSVLTWKRILTWHAWQRKEESSRWLVRYTERIFPQESSCTTMGHGKSKYLRLNEENKKENRGEATYLWICWRKNQKRANHEQSESGSVVQCPDSQRAQKWGRGPVRVSSGRRFAQIYERCFSETGSKDGRGFPVKRFPKDGTGDCGWISFRIFTVLVKKKNQKQYLQVGLRKHGR